MNCPTCGKEYTDEDVARDEKETKVSEKPIREEIEKWRQQSVEILERFGIMDGDAMWLNFHVLLRQMKETVREDETGKPKPDDNEEKFSAPPTDPVQRWLWELSLKELVDYMYQDISLYKKTTFATKPETLGEVYDRLLRNFNTIMQEHIEKYHNEFILCEVCKNYHHKSEIMGIGCDVCKSCFNSPRKPNETNPDA